MLVDFNNMGDTFQFKCLTEEEAVERISLKGTMKKRCT